jgi:predicted transcriptional regulator
MKSPVVGRELRHLERETELADDGVETATAGSLRSRMSSKNGKPAILPRSHGLDVEAQRAAPYVRQPGESEARFTMFVAYRDQLADGRSRRSLRDLANTLGVSDTIVSRYSSEDNWPARVAAWDREQDETRRAELQHEIRVIARRQAETLCQAADGLMAPIVAYAARVHALKERGKDPFVDYSLSELAKEAREAARLVPQVIKMERLVHGLSNETVGNPIEVRLEDARRRARQMTRDELEAMLVDAE